jgi:hypothetical protein
MVCCRGWRSWHVQTIGYCHWQEDEPVRQVVLYENHFGWMDVSELNPNWRDRFGWRPLRHGGNHFGWSHPWSGEADRAPFSIKPWPLPYNWEKSRRTSVRLASWCWTLVAASAWPSFLGEALTGLLSIKSSSDSRGWLQRALGWHSCLPSCRTKGFPASANFESKLCQCSDVVCKEWNPQILGNLRVTNVARCVSRNATINTNCNLFKRLLWGTHRQHGDLIRLTFFFKESRLKIR